jgi:hypothetical protein
MRVDQVECKEHHGKEAWIDVHGGYNFIACCNCGKTLQIKKFIYDMILPELRVTDEFNLFSSSDDKFNIFNRSQNGNT